MLFDLILSGLFRSAIYSSPNGSLWPSVLLLHHLRLQCPICFLLDILGPFAFLGFLDHFPNSAFPWAFTNFFGLSKSNYLIPHPWGSWACHQSLTFFTCITLGLLWPILTFLHHILPMSLLLLSFRASLSLFAFSRPICLFHDLWSIIPAAWA